MYSSVPVSPLAALLLVKAAGSNGAVPLWAAAMVPPVVGLVHPDIVVVLTDTEPQLAPALFTARNCILYVVSLVKPAIVNGLVVTAGEGVTHVVPLFIEYS